MNWVSHNRTLPKHSETSIHRCHSPGDFEATLGYPSPVQSHLRNKIPTTSSMESAHSPGGKEDFYPLMGLDHDHLLKWGDIRWLVWGSTLGFLSSNRTAKRFPKLCFWTNHTKTWACKLFAWTVSVSGESPPRAHYLGIKCKLWKKTNNSWTTWNIDCMHSTLRFLHYFLDYPCIVTHHNHHKHKLSFQKFIQQPPAIPNQRNR